MKSSCRQRMGGRNPSQESGSNSSESLGGVIFAKPRPKAAFFCFPFGRIRIRRFCYQYHCQWCQRPSRHEDTSLMIHVHSNLVR